MSPDRKDPDIEDLEIACMSALVIVMEDAFYHNDIDLATQQRIARWFGERYSGGEFAGE